MPWSYKGYTISQPGVIDVQDNSGISDSPASVSREIVVVGSSGGGVPKTVTTINGISDAISKLVSGTGLTALLRTLKSSPQSVKFVRVDPAVQSTYNLVNGATTVLQLTTVDYGDYTKLTNTQVKAGSVKGLYASLAQNSKSFTQDNIYAGAITIQYTGADASGLVTVSNSAGNIQGLSGASGSEVVKWTASFSTYATVQDLVNYINTQAGWVATISSAPKAGVTANYFDDATSQACKASAYTVTANLDALKAWYNATGIVTAVRPASVGTTPTVMTGAVYFIGGSTGTATNSDWSSALQALQNENLARIIVAATGDASIHAMVDAHCGAMSLPNVNKNRVQIAGGVSGETVTQVTSRASALNSRRTSLVYPGVQDIDMLTSTLTTYDPFYAAAQVAGMLASSGITQALTRQNVACKGLEGTLQTSLQSSDYDTLTNAGVLAIRSEQTQTGGTIFYVVRSVTTWLQDTKLPNVEISMVCNEDYVSLRISDAINAYLVGKAGSPVGVGQVTSVIDSGLRACVDDGSLVGDSNMAAYSKIVVSLANGVVQSSYLATIPAPMNFFGVTSAFQLYSKTA